MSTIAGTMDEAHYMCSRDDYQYDPPIAGFEKKKRVRIRFHSGTSELIPQGLALETVVARLNGMSVTDQGNFGFWCNGNVEANLIKQPACDQKDVAHSPHGIPT